MTIDKYLRSRLTFDLQQLLLATLLQQFSGNMNVLPEEAYYESCNI